MAYPFGRTRRWTRADYDRLIAEGAFDHGDPVELLGASWVAFVASARPIEGLATRGRD